MPIYEYRCASCGAELEKLQKISDPPLRECPECGKEALVKLVSASSFRLSGSGWYETDFKTGKKKHGAGDAPSEGAASADSAGAESAATAKEPKKEAANGAAKEAGKGAVKSSEGSGAGTAKKSEPKA